MELGDTPLSYVSIRDDVMRKITEQATARPEEQVIGLLVGRLLNDAIVIEDAPTGEAVSERHKARLLPESLAKIADDIVKGRIEGNVIGWYHSHTDGGIFMSKTDIDTQTKLQQFSPLVTAMVVDAKSGEAGFFRVNSLSGKALPIPKDKIYVFKAGEDPLPPSLKGKTYAPPEQGRAAEAAARPALTRRALIGLALTIILTVGAVAGLLYWAIQAQRPTPTPKKEPIPLDVELISPPTKGIVLRELTVKANVTGGVDGVKNVTLIYRRSSVDAWTTVPMYLQAPNTTIFIYTIPASEVTEDVHYFVKAYDRKDNEKKSDVYTVRIGTFDLSVQEGFELVRVVRGGGPKEARLTIRSLNEFSGTVRILVEHNLVGVSIAPVTPSVNVPKGGQLTLVIRISAGGGAEIVALAKTVKVVAVYQVGALRYQSEASFKVAVTGFDISSVEPTSQEVTRDKKAVKLVNYTFTVTIYPGLHEFLTPSPESIAIEIQGLPSGTTYELSLASITFLQDGTVKVTYKITIKVSPDASAGNFTFTIYARFAGITRSVSAWLLIR